ncbi:tubulin-folding cofactor C-like [Phragmites australis]|uniref:tubulin-folding cofactor C-like n=1 Tax=Phragmites australis TaxID=29695 RepID=UPI002D781078|nr:tubulin-folding cofactor C-like [Phragmites australis]
MLKSSYLMWRTRARESLQMPSGAAAASAVMEGEPEPDQPKAAAASGHRKHLAMLERLSKRSSSSAAAPSSDSTGASPVEAFLSRFAPAKLAAESALSACRASPEDAPASLAAAAAAIDDLDHLVAEASHALPLYELRSALAAAAELRAAHRVAADDLRRKKSFSFRNKSRAPKNPPQDSPTMLPPPPPPEQPKPSLDSILPGFGFRGRNGATLVKDLRVSNDKDGDFSLADLVSCEVSLKGKCRALYVHKLRHCRVFVGAVVGSVLIEDVEGCTFVMAAHQIRIHEARATDFYLRVRSRPIIEDCSGVRFAPHALKYEGIEEDLRESGLEEETGNWVNVDDFKWLRAVHSPNWCLVPEEERMQIVDISEVHELEDDS